VALYSCEGQDSTDLSFEEVCAMHSLHCLYECIILILYNIFKYR
jgi:hypothetical protein